MDEATTEVGTHLQRADDAGEIEHHHASADESLVRLAIEQKVPVEVLERLVALQERAQERSARAAYFDAMAKFQSEVGPVPKTGVIAVPNRDGTKEVRSRFAPLSAIAEHIREPLTRNGLMYSWDSTLEDGMVDVRCTVRHVDGHSETASFTFKASDASAPGMNGVQVAGSARTYGERYSLIQALGLTTADPDDDGQGAGLDAGDVITPEQADTIRSMIEEVGADEAKFLRWLKVESVDAIPASRAKEAVTALERKREKVKA